MPPQQPIQNQQFNQNQAPVAPTTPPSDKFAATIKAFLSYGLVVTAAGIVLSTLFIPFTPSTTQAHAFSVGAIIFGLIFQGIIWIIIGTVFSIIFPFVRDIVKGIPGINKAITSTYDLMWKPYLYINSIFFAFGLLTVFGLGTIARGALSSAITGSLFFAIITATISFAVNLYVYNWFAKTVSSKLAAYYPWN